MARTLKRSVRTRVGVAAAAAVAALASSSVPAHAAPPPAESMPAVGAAPVTIDFGNGITGSVDPATSQLSLVTGTPLVWDPNLEAIDRYSFGPGWTLNTSFMDVNVFYIPGVGSYAYDQTWEPSHLHGYEGDDYVANWFADAPVTLPARGDIPAQDAYKTLYRNSTGVTAYFSWNGNLIATIDKSGARKDWWFQDDVTTNLAQIVESDGRVTYFLEVRTPWEWAIQAPDGKTTYLSFDADGSGTIRTVPSGVSSFFPKQTFFGVTTSRYEYQDLENSANDVSITLTWDTNRPAGTVTRIERNNVIVYPVG